MLLDQQMSRNATLEALDVQGPPVPSTGVALPVIVPPDLAHAPRRAAKGRARFAVALLAAVGVHAAALAAAAMLMRETGRFGADGIELDVITVGLVDASAIDARPNVEPSTAAPVTSNEPVRPSDGAEAATPVEATLPPPAPASAPAKLTDTVAAPEPSEIQLALRQPAEPAPPAPREPIETASITPPPQSPAADGGAATRANTPALATTASAVKASAGVVTAYARSVAEALGKNPPKRVGMPGLTWVSFRITTTGTPSAVEVTTSSGNSRIDDAAKMAVRMTSFTPPPPSLSVEQRTFNVPYRFK